jgi:hypothetical protein
MEETPHPLAERIKVDNYQRVITVPIRKQSQARPGLVRREDAFVKMAEAEGTKKGMTTAQ